MMSNGVISSLKKVWRRDPGAVREGKAEEWGPPPGSLSPWRGGRGARGSGDPNAVRDPNSTLVSYVLNTRT